MHPEPSTPELFVERLRHCEAVALKQLQKLQYTTAKGHEDEVRLQARYAFKLIYEQLSAFTEFFEVTPVVNTLGLEDLLVTTYLSWDLAKLYRSRGGQFVVLNDDPTRYLIGVKIGALEHLREFAKECVRDKKSLFTAVQNRRQARKDLTRLSWLPRL